MVVNNASVYPRTALGEISAETWDAIFAANLRAPFLLSQRLGLAMKASGGGQIVNLGDWAGLRPYRSYLPYVVSKAGLIHMTRALALELAPEVRVNCVCPGPVLLPEGYDAATAEGGPTRDPARAARGSGRDRARGAVLRREWICDRRNPHARRAGK